MSRSGYSEDLDSWELIRWRGAVAASIKGKRGQMLLNNLAMALDEMPEKKLIKHELKCDQGSCALGTLGAKIGLDMSWIDPEDSETVARAFNISEALAKEVVFINDEECGHMTPEARWQYMRTWVKDHLVPRNVQAVKRREKKI